MIGITTKFQGLSDNELYKMYRIEEWKEMNERDKQQLLQETVVRSAEKRGEVGCCIVNFEDLPDGTLGTHRNGVISLNRSHYAVGAENIEYKGKIITREIPAVNWDALETVLHEDIHEWQSQLVRGEINGDPELVYEYRANGFSVSPVEFTDKNGTITTAMGLHYLDGDSRTVDGSVSTKSYLLYHFQATERDAHRWSQSEAIQIAKNIEQEYGPDCSISDYIHILESQGYQAIENKANNLFNNSNVEKEINQSLKNHYYDTYIPVSKDIEDSVSQEMIGSYQRAFMFVSNDKNPNIIDSIEKEIVFSEVIKDSSSELFNYDLVSSESNNNSPYTCIEDNSG
nr:hypothetical protein [Lachnospiraceae bacterium]